MEENINEVQTYYDNLSKFNGISPDYEYVERDSVIMKVKKDNTWFICNRNSDDFDTIFNDKYVKFWEIDNVSYLTFSNCDDIVILQTLPLDNFNRRHQTIINKHKQKWIDELLLQDIELSNKDMTNIKKQYRNIFYNQWKDYFHTLIAIENLEEKIYEYSKRLFYTDKDNEWFFHMTRDEIWKHEKWTKEQKVIFIITRDHIWHKKYAEKSKYPFLKFNIKKQIKNLIRNYRMP